MSIKKIRTLDGGGISVRDHWMIEPQVRNKKYQVNIKLPNGKVRYLYLDDPNIADLYIRLIGAKILKIRKL